MYVSVRKLGTTPVVLSRLDPRIGYVAGGFHANCALCRDLMEAHSSSAEAFLTLATDLVNAADGYEMGLFNGASEQLQRAKQDCAAAREAIRAHRAISHPQDHLAAITPSRFGSS